MNILLSMGLWITYVVSLYFAIFFLLIFLDYKSHFGKKKKITLTEFPYVSIFIPAYNEEDTVLGTVESVLNLEYPKEKLEIIVIDDGSTDHTKKIMDEFIQKNPFITLLSHKNRGKAASLNRALKNARGEYFACLDADSFVERDALKNMLNLYQTDQNKNLAIVTPAMKVKSPKTLLQKVQWIEYLVMIFVSRLASHIDSLYVAPGPFSLYKTKTIKDLGGFDEKNLTEDQEIAYRVQEAHYQIRQCPSAFVHTVTPANLRAFSKQRRRWYKGSLSCLYKYRKLILNKKYGDFGVMQMLKNSVGFLLAVSGMGFTFYYLFLPIVEQVRNLALIRFDILPYLQDIKLNLNLLTFDINRIFILALLLGISIFFFYISHKNAEEKLNKLGLIPVIPYFLVYYLVKGSILLISIVEYSIGKKKKW